MSLCFYVTTIPSDYEKNCFGLEHCFLVVKNPPRNTCLNPPRNRSNPPRNTPCNHWTDFTLRAVHLGACFLCVVKYYVEKYYFFSSHHHHVHLHHSVSISLASPKYLFRGTLLLFEEDKFCFHFYFVSLV